MDPWLFPLMQRGIYTPLVPPHDGQALDKGESVLPMYQDGLILHFKWGYCRNRRKLTSEFQSVYALRWQNFKAHKAK